MKRIGQVWAIVLAGGSGTRVQHMTGGSKDAPTPKQYCRFDGKEAMVRWAIRRAERLAPKIRILSVVAEQHKSWWHAELADLPDQNVIVQPRDRGTAAGLLLPILEVLRRDKDARVVILPSDHFVADENALSGAIADALNAVRGSGRVALLGVQPRSADTEYGWIVPIGTEGTLRPVAAFVEKPEPYSAGELMRHGALLNTFILVGSARSLLHMYASSVPDLLGAFVSRQRGLSKPAVVRELYRDIPKKDFSRHVLQRTRDDLSVLRLPECGWSDLGSPWRLNAYLHQLPDSPRSA